MQLLIGILLCFSASFAFASSYEVEPNDSIPVAMPISLGQPIQGNIATETDADRFRFNSGTFTSLRVLYARPPRSYQYNLATIRVSTAAGTALSSVDAYAPDVFTSFDVGVDAGLDYILDVAGCTGSDCEDHRSELYEVMVVGLPNPTFESEPNNTTAQADSVAPTGWVFGQHGSKTDDDVYRVQIPGPGQFFAHLTRPQDDYLYTLARIEILDTNGVLLNADDVFASNGQGRVVLGLTSAATIYVRVKSCPSGSRCDIVFSNPYQVVFGFRPATNCEIFRDGFDCSASAVKKVFSLPSSVTSMQ